LKTSLRKANKKIENLEELLESYKVEKNKNRAELEHQWSEMTQFYEMEIDKLNNKLIDLQPKMDSKFIPTKLPFNQPKQTEM
jgi:coenzyme F420-reducing hydrogenase delta subunit